MKYATHLYAFLREVEQNEKLLPTHISLYLALFQLWRHHHFQNPIPATRTELMRISKISSRTTYQRCVKDLENMKWLTYTSSHSIYKGSLFWFLPFASCAALSLTQGTCPLASVALPTAVEPSPKAEKATIKPDKTTPDYDEPL